MGDTSAPRIKGKSSTDFRLSAVANVRRWTMKAVLGGLVYAVLDVAEAIRELARMLEAHR